MTDADTDTADPDDSEEPPEIEDDERADVDLDAISDDIEGVEDDDEAGDSDDSPADAEEPTTDTPDVPSGMTVGDIYCNGLGVGTSVLLASYGEVDDRKQVGEDYADLAREIQLDTFVNEWLAEKGRPENLPPQEAAIVGTVMFAAAVMVSNPDVAENILNGVSEA